MPRDIPIGNGHLLIAFDSEYQIREFCYPHVGDENHAYGFPFRFGVYCDGRLSWACDSDWQRRLDYEPSTLVTDVELDNSSLRLRLRCNDAVDFHEPIYVRRISVTNDADTARQVRVFFHHDFRIRENDVGDTAYYNPELNVVLHYKENRYFLINACKADGSGLDDYATGVKGRPGFDGTWRDAEGDGSLGRNPIAQGSVDSTVAVHLELGPGETQTFHYWVCVSDNYELVKTYNREVLDKSPETLLKRTAAYWRLWVNKDEFDLGPLPSEVDRLYRRSLLILRTQISHNGAITAANDSDILQFARDTYSYVWPRDGALVAHALDLAGHSSLASEFYHWCRRVVTKYGYFLHKYNPDGSAGSSWHPWVQNGDPQLPIQEDETALVIWALWKHFDKYRDIELMKPLYRDLIIRASLWMADFRDEATGLPLPSYDLWEERRGITAWTVGAVYGGLIAGANFACSFGEDAVETQLREAAEGIKAAAERHLWREEWNRYARMVTLENGEVKPDPTLDASQAGLFLFGMIHPCDPRMNSTMNAIRERLTVKTEVGGVARYENDYYHQISKDVARVPGNPWFVCTLWLADYLIARAQTRGELEEALPILRWCADHALPSGVLAEQVHPDTHQPLSVSPLTWSHAGFVTSVVGYLDRLAALDCCPTCGQELYSKERPKIARDHEHYEVHRLPKSVSGEVTSAGA